jgi:hypothetical protein
MHGATIMIFKIYPLNLLRVAKLLPVCMSRLSMVFSVSTRHAVGLYWVPGHAGVRVKEIADGIARDGSVLNCVIPEPALGVYRQDIRRRIRRWLVNQYCIWWRGVGDT